jgi:hypothetical protein
MLILSGSAILESCSTVAPQPVESRSIAFDGSYQTAGIAKVDVSKKLFVVDQFFLSQFNARAVKFGNRFNPPVKSLPEGAKTVTPEQMTQSLSMARYEREGRAK